MKMLPEDGYRIVDLCRQMRQTASQEERMKLIVAIKGNWDKVSEPLVTAAEDAVFFGIFGQERERATPLEALPALASSEADVYVLPEPESGSHTES
ncbi:MAG: hypothetical protein NT154_47440 [Verrucomicrobia bacterium]|nr:hypothetical protein [Verrucomicrobiota bacterium]